MGDFSRDPGARLQDSVAKHYVGVRLQQGVPILDADWNELEDLRRHEQASLFQRFFGDGVPDGNDGFRVDGLAGGGVGTVVLQAASVPLGGVSSLEIDFPGSTAASLLGFLPEMGSTRRPAANPARLPGNLAGPFALAAGLTLTVRTNGEAPETVTFAAGDFADIGAATTAEVVAALNAGMGRAVAQAGTGNDFVVHGGDGTVAGAGRLLVEGVEAVAEADLAYTSQPLHENPELAAAWGVPAVPALATPAADRRDLVYLDVWDREVGSAEDDAMVLPAVGVEATVRLRREWAVRVAEGVEALAAVPRLPGHRYAALARLERGAGQAGVPAGAVVDLRVRSLNVARYLKTPIHYARGAQLLDADGYAGLLEALREVLLLRLSSRAYPFTYADAYDEAVVLGAVRDVAQQAAFAAIQARTGSFNNDDGFGFLRTLHGLQGALVDTIAALGNGGGSAQAFVDGWRDRLDGAAGITGLGPALDTGDLLAAAGAQEAVNAWLSAPVDLLPEGDVVVTIVSVLPASNLAVNVPFNVTYRVEGQLASPQAQETIDLAVQTAAPSTWTFALSRSSVTVASMGGQDTATLTVTPRAGTV
ncbi:MAG TPA: hypothetical protein VHG51_00865, partial [Longimicrobiaceae bacterium]|nr:hypothetical protein [Longimicrobiaceae bacterium]